MFLGKSRQDHRASHEFYTQAWERTLADPSLKSRLGLLTIAGIAVAWSEMLEDASHRADRGALIDAASETYGTLLQIYDSAKDRLAKNPASVTNEVRIRVVSMAVKLANLAERDAQMEKQSEEQLTWAV